MMTNTTCDIYRNASSPPAAPAVAGVAGWLQGEYANGRVAHETDLATRWTHLMILAPTIDVRDGWANGEPLQAGAFDRVYVPDKNGTAFSVVFVERTGRGTTQDVKRVYLRREQATFPTNEV